MMNEMTAEEAIEVFKSELDWAEQNRYPYISENKVKATKLAIQALEQELSEDKTKRFIKHKIDYLEELASIETNEGRWREEEKYLYAVSVLEEVVEYMNTSGGEAE